MELNDVCFFCCHIWTIVFLYHENANLSCDNAQIIHQVKATADKLDILGYTAHKKVNYSLLLKNNGHAP